MIRVEGHKHLYRDPRSNAIVNTDTQGYREYIRMRNMKNSENDRIAELENELQELKKLVHDLLTR